MYYSSRILLYSKSITVFYFTQTLLYLQENSVLYILKKNDVSQALKGHFIIDQYFSVLISGSYTGIQEDITLKLQLDNLFSNLKDRV